MKPAFPSFPSPMAIPKQALMYLEKLGYIAGPVRLESILEALTLRQAVAYNYLDLVADWKAVATYLARQPLPGKFEESSTPVVKPPFAPVNQGTDISKVTYRIGELRYYSTRFDVFLNLKVICNIVTGKVFPQKTGVVIDQETAGKKYFRLHIPYYEKDKPVAGPAIILATADFYDFIFLLKLMRFSYSSENIKAIVAIFREEIAKANGDRDLLDELYYVLPEDVLIGMESSELWRDLALLLAGNLNEYGTNEEAAVLKMVSSICDPRRLSEPGVYNAEASAILERLFTEKAGDEVLFMHLFNKLNDYGGDNNFSACMENLVAIWELSTYYLTGPHEIHYDSSDGGLFYDDSYQFILQEDNRTMEVHSMEEGLEGENIWSKDGEWNVLNRFSIPRPERVKVPEQEDVRAVMPGFYLMAIDAKNRAANTEIGVFLGLDILTCITGLGPLIRFRHLATLFKMSEQALLKGEVITKAFIGHIEIASGAVSAALKIFKGENTPLGRAIGTCLFYMEILSLGADVLTSGLLRRTSGRLLDEYANVPAQHLDIEIVNLLEQLAERRAQAIVQVSNADLEKMLGGVVRPANLKGVVRVCNNLKVSITKNITANPPPGIGLYQIAYKGKEILDADEDYLKALFKHFDDLYSNSTANKIEEYLDMALDAANKRKLAYRNWFTKFYNKFHDHFDGEIETIVNKHGYIEYKASGAHNHTLNGSQINITTIRKPNGISALDHLPFDTPFSANVELKHLTGYIQKNRISSFFPYSWSLNRVKEEIAYVYEKMSQSGIQFNFKNNKFKALDSTGTFLIQIEFDEVGNLTSAYPWI